jgi:hypothetical protein
METNNDDSHPQLRRRPAVVARIVLSAFLFTFIAARVLVYMIMARTIPDLYLHVGGTHVHHLNYGIFLMSAVGLVLVMFSPTGKLLTFLTLCYGVALGLTFDEFGMWIHLGGGYWQRASFDAVVVIGAFLGLIAAAPAMRCMHRRQWITAALLCVALAVFWVLFYQSFSHAEKDVRIRLRQLDETGPT